MSSAFPSDSTANRDVGILRTAVKYPLRLLGFWSAVFVPFVLLGLIVAGVAQHSPALIAALVGANVTGLVLGKEYNQ
jgi:hypothetical protein